MAAKPRARRGRSKNKAPETIDESRLDTSNGDATGPDTSASDVDTSVPELDATAPEVDPAPTASPLCLDDGGDNSDNIDLTKLLGDDENGIKTNMDILEEPTIEQAIGLENMIEESEADEKLESTVQDAEMVSEDELPENEPDTKEPLDTEAVSDEELKEESQGPLETEAVSDEELPEDKRKKAKVAEAEAVSEDELPDDVEKKAKDEDEGNEVGNEKKRKIADGDYDPNSPTSENSNDGSPAAKKVALGDATGTPQPAGKKPLPELEKHWKAVKDDPSDFTGWTYLLQYVDQENDIEVAREAYDGFLLHYPYCYGYWRKYADYEKRKGNSEECERVFERGLKAIPLSVDLWLHYLNYVKAAYIEDKEYVRAQFERSLEACGLEFRSDRLWESYIKWEKERKNLINITAIYDQLLAIPTQGYTTHFDSFQDHVNSNPPQTIMPMDDFLELRREVLAELKENEKTGAAAAAAAVADDAPPGEDVDTDKDELSVANSTASMEEETNALRGKILSHRRKLHKATVAAVATRWNFEEGIKRPYFHVKPLERCQLKNWRDYLEFEIEQGDELRVITLFERCLIACALYEEFWTTFIKYLKGRPSNQTAKIRDVYERACLIHHKKKPNLHLQWAAFEETVDNFDKAASILENVENTSSNLLQVAYRRINLERRRGNNTKVCELYEEYLTANKTKTHIFSNMTVKYARFVWKFMNDVDKAIDILEKALDNDKDNTRLYLQLIDMGLQKNPVDEARIVSILDQFLDKEGDLDQKVMFAQRKIEFLEDFGSSIDDVQKAQDDFQKYIKQVKDKKKKQETEPSTTPSSGAKKSKSDSGSTNPPMPSAPPPSSGQTGYQSGQYPSNYYGQYPPPSGGTDQYGNNYNYNYSNWNSYPQGQYNNYGQSGWPSYYPSNY